MLLFALFSAGVVVSTTLALVKNRSHNPPPYLEGYAAKVVKREVAFWTPPKMLRQQHTAWTINEPYANVSAKLQEVVRERQAKGLPVQESLMITGDLSSTRVFAVEKPNLFDLTLGYALGKGKLPVPPPVHAGPEFTVVRVWGGNVSVIVSPAPGRR